MTQKYTHVIITDVNSQTSVGDVLYLRHTPMVDKGFPYAVGAYKDENCSEFVTFVAENEVFRGAFEDYPDALLCTDIWMATTKEPIKVQIRGVKTGVGPKGTRLVRGRADFVIKTPDELKRDAGFFTIGGTVRDYPEKPAFLEALNEKQLQVELKQEEDDSIVAYYKNTKVGRVDEKELSGENLGKLKNGTLYAKATKVLEKLQVEAVVISEMDAEIELSASDYDFVVKKGILTQEELSERLAYLEDNKVMPNMIKKIFMSMEKLDDEALKDVPSKPECPFIDSDSILMSSIGVLNIGSNLCLEGLMGTGKNVLTETLAWLYHRPMYEFSMNSGVNNMDILGSETLVNGSVEFLESAVIKAAKNGGVLVLDEFNTALPHVLTLFNSLLDDRRTINVPRYENVIAKKNFVAIATQNPNYIGTTMGNEATKNRFVKVIFDNPADVRDIVIQGVPEIKDSTEFLNNLYDFNKELVSLVASGTFEPTVLNVRGYKNAAKLIAFEGFSASMAMRIAVLNAIDDNDTKTEVSSIMDAIFG